MKYDHRYGGLIWTNHAIEQMNNRGLSQDLAWEAFKNPDFSQDAREPDSIKYQKKLGQSQVGVIAKQNEKNEWVIISAWIDPPLPGSADAKAKENYQKYQQAGFFKKFWLTFLHQVGF